MTWHIARVRFGKARSIARGLTAEYGFATMCPLERRIIIVRGQKTESLIPIFGPFFLIEAPLADDAEAWQAVATWPHVVEIMGGLRPIPVIFEEIDFWRDQIDVDGIVVNPKTLDKLRNIGIVVGDRVVVDHEPFRDLQGTCVRVDENLFRVEIKIDGLLGRDQGVTIPVAWCRKTNSSAPPLGDGRRHNRGGRRGERARRAAKLLAAAPGN